MKRANLIYCCRSGQCNGHIDRALAVAEELSERFQVTVLLDDSFLSMAIKPGDVDLLFLPTNNADARRTLMMGKVTEIAPRVVVIEDFPFRWHEQKEEFLSVIQMVRGNAHEESLVVSMTDGVLASDIAEEKNAAENSADFLERYFDMVVVQSDPVFARLEEFFQPISALSTPMFHAGFVSPATHHGRRARKISAGGILVSAGDGFSGGGLFRAAIEAHRILRHTLPLPMAIVAGEHLPEDEWQELLSLAAGSPALTLVRTVADIRAEVANAQLSVSQCGYSATVNAIAARTPTLFVPREGDHYREELIRAKRMVYWGAGRLVIPRLMNGASLANEIQQFAKFERREMKFDLDGAAKAAQLLADVVYQNNYAPAQLQTSSHTRPH